MDTQPPVKQAPIDTPSPDPYHDMRTMQYETPQTNADEGEQLPSNWLVTLYVAANEGSVQAFDALEQAEICFRVIPELERAEPCAVWEEMTFEGLAAIQDLARTLQAVDSSIIQKAQEFLPDVWMNRDLGRAQQAEERRRRQLDEAHAVMSHLFDRLA